MSGKIRGFIVNIIGWYSRYLEDTCFRIILKTNGMLFSDKSCCVPEIHGWPLPPKNFTILTQKIKPAEELKNTWVYCLYYMLGF